MPFWNRKKMKYVAVFVRPEGDRYIIVGKKDFNIDDKSIRWNDHNIPITTQNFHHQEGTTVYKYFDVENDEEITLIQTKNPLSLKDIDIFTDRHFLSSMMNSLKDKSTGYSAIWAIIVGIIIGGFIGYTVAGVLNPPQTIIHYVNSNSTGTGTPTAIIGLFKYYIGEIIK